ncbi:Nramp family divalent metal transporter [Desulfofundulus salinus]|uniref:Divalent metal cation transporter n=1 Tax=Desulfofundulus salinus TaxID=2419843 RepID=A0A494WRJ9_9FIRM|nr:Nramp family divalent metal transporter [Desulfofundulus salinum]RKO65858.1 divalent metal cation transporter [Desulfofundulus salinum]
MKAEKNNFWTRLKNVGPAAVVSAAFIGPGTVTTATLAGVQFKYALLWAMLFSTIATMILQEMSARVGIVTGKGLGTAIKNTFEQPAARLAAVLLIVAAIGVGNSAFQSGNISGASMGLQVLFGATKQVWVAVIGLTAFALLWTGSYKLVEKVLVAMVVLMSLVFLTTAVVIKPNVGELLRGLFVPVIPPGALLVTLGIIGTTVVPYNLYLHASAAAERWGGIAEKQEAIKASKLDLLVSIGLGGVISLAIIITASSLFGSGVEVKTAGDMAKQLEPLLGPWAKWFFAIGLFAAGATSAITAPMAAAYAITGVAGWNTDMKSAHFRAIWIIVLAIGAVVAYVGVNPVQLILFAQAVNGILLPISAIFLLMVVNQEKIMKNFVNGGAMNLAGIAVVLVTVVLGIRMILKAFKVI